MTSIRLPSSARKVLEFVFAIVIGLAIAAAFFVVAAWLKLLAGGLLANEALCVLAGVTVAVAIFCGITWHLKWHPQSIVVMGATLVLATLALLLDSPMTVWQQWAGVAVCFVIYIVAWLDELMG